MKERYFLSFAPDETYVGVRHRLLSGALWRGGSVCIAHGPSGRSSARKEVSVNPKSHVTSTEILTEREVLLSHVIQAVA